MEERRRRFSGRGRRIGRRDKEPTKKTTISIPFVNGLQEIFLPFPFPANVMDFILLQKRAFPFQLEVVNNVRLNSSKALETSQDLSHFPWASRSSCLY